MATMPRPRSEAFASTLAARVGRFRWTICALLFFAATINYIDRQPSPIHTNRMALALDGRVQWIAASRE